MKKYVFFLILIVLTLGLSACEVEEPYEPTVECKATGYDYDYTTINDYQLVWYDEFDRGSMPDPTFWTYETGGSGWGNNELQYYTNGQNVFIEDGVLVIEARKEFYSGREYTSTRMVTRNKAGFKYGKFEIRAILPTGTGTWPAIWMMPTTSYYGTWPNSGEIDIMEHVGYNQNVVYGSIHTKSYNHKIGTQRGGSITIPTASTEFHVYSIEWLPDRIMFFVDGVKYYTFAPGLSLNCPTKDQWPFDNRFFFILNIAVGGDWGGARGVDDEIFPQRMSVDYIRVYQSQTVNNLRND
jgi:beta-glucanase (GH16 family)